MVRNYKIVKDLLFSKNKCQNINDKYKKRLKENDYKKCILIKNKLDKCYGK